MANNPFVARHGLDANGNKVTSVAPPTHNLAAIDSKEGVNYEHWRLHTPALPKRNDITYIEEEIVLGTVGNADPAETVGRLYICVLGHQNQPLNDVTYWKQVESGLYYSIVTTNTSAASGNVYFADTTANVITITLPAAPLVDDVVTVVDYANTFKTYNCTIEPGALKIEGSTDDWVLVQDGSEVELTYTGTTMGWKVTSTNIIDGGTF